MKGSQLESCIRYMLTLDNIKRVRKDDVREQDREDVNSGKTISVEILKDCPEKFRMAYYIFITWH